MTTTTITTTITAHAATEAGALAGFRITCSACGPIGGSSLETTAELEARRHVEWHERRHQAQTGRGCSCGRRFDSPAELDAHRAEATR